ncbi:MAG: hypothetical protein JRI68_35460, partial [Deltaproteobacteria bacterium]|nr:hypothetical protein [Deltaproteobacteria bacterium]
VALSECPSCRRVRQQAGGEMVEVDRSVLEQAECDGLHIGRVDGGLPSRAFSTVSPAVRRMVLARHGGACRAPGCTNSAWVHIHHFDQGASRGDHDPDRLICLCSTHHRLHHKGKLLIRGKSWRDVEFFHVDGTPYGEKTRRKEAVDSHPVFHGLTGLGFSKSEARKLLSLAMTHVGREASEEELLREALRRSRSAPEPQAKDGAPTSAQGRPYTPAETRVPRHRYQGSSGLGRGSGDPHGSWGIGERPAVGGTRSEVEGKAGGPHRNRRDPRHQRDGRDRCAQPEPRGGTRPKAPALDGRRIHGPRGSGTCVPADSELAVFRPGEVAGVRPRPPERRPRPRSRPRTTRPATLTRPPENLTTFGLRDGPR